MVKVDKSKRAFTLATAKEDKNVLGAFDGTIYRKDPKTGQLRRITPKGQKVKPVEVRHCPDCGLDVPSYQLHADSCRAHICDKCETSYYGVIEQNADGKRICEECK